MATEAEETAAVVGKPVMVMGVDDSEHSFHALQWTLLHFFSSGVPGHSSSYKIVIVNAKPTPSSVISLAGLGAADVLPFVESDLRKIALNVLEKAKEICGAHSVTDVEYVVMEGDARNVLCEAVEKYHAEMLVVGSHGYGAIKRTGNSHLDSLNNKTEPVHLSGF